MNERNDIEGELTTEPAATAQISLGDGESAPVDRPIDTSAAKILIVDDRSENLLALEAILETLGHPIVRAESGREALRELMNGEFAVILMDVHMPNLDGFETAALIKKRERTRRIPIIFLTAMTPDDQFIARGYAQGAVDYLGKPFDPRVLRAKVSVFLDLSLKTEQIRAQAERLKEQERQALMVRSEARFRTLIDLLPIAAWAARPDGRIHYANEAAQRVSGASEGCHLTEIGSIHEDDRPQVRAAWASSLRSGEASDVQFRMLIGGQHRWHLGRGVAEREDGRADGAIIGWIATATDIDDQKRAEETQRAISQRAQDARAAAEAASRMKDEFLATVSHELRTPLTAILGWATLLGRRLGNGDPEIGRALEALERNARMQSQLIEDLLDVSRIISGKLHLEIRHVDFATIAEAALEAVAPAAAAKDVAIDLNIDSAFGAVDVDPDRLQQVLWNLLSNAIKFTPAGGRVEISGARPNAGGDYEIRVSDSGVGIPAEFLPHVFERFRQADSSTTRSAGGLGLGLAIVRHVVELHGGTVTAHSAGANQGATFVIRLPQRVSAEVRPVERRTPVAFAAAPAPTTGPNDIKGVRILLVDDSEDNRELLAEVLELHGALVVVAASAAAAMAAFERETPDVLISDLGMPVEDGYSLVQRIRALESLRGGHVPAIALTGFARPEDKQRVAEAGFDAHMAKPVEPDQLIAAVARFHAQGRYLAAQTQTDASP